MKRARVAGAGIAALCAARCLVAHGWTVRLRGRPPSGSPTLVVNAVTADLLQSLFGGGELFAGSHRLRRRHVRWGAGAEPIEVDEPALVMSEGQLMNRLRARLVRDHGDRVVLEDEHLDTAPVEWEVSGGGRAAARGQRFGERRMLVAEMALSASADPSTARIETTSTGWLFLVPSGAGRAMVQAMVAAVGIDPTAQLRAILAEAPTIRHQLIGEPATASVFDAAPSLGERRSRRGWIAVGDEAMSLDPLCGDGAGSAARGAILAAAVIEDIAGGLPAEVGLAHYRARLETALAHHLRACRRFYGAAGFDASWDSELRATARWLAVVEAQLAQWPGFGFGLRGLRLAPLTAVAGA